MNRVPVGIIAISDTTVDTNEMIIFYGTSSYDGEEPYEELYGEAGHEIAKYLWDFGDGNTSELPVSSHSYPDNGIYNATLTVWDNEGAHGRSWTNIIVRNRIPIAEFSVEPVTGWVTTLFVLNASNSMDYDGDIVRYFWDFGDGTIGHGVYCNHTYAKPGTYIVILTVFDDEANDTYTIIIGVKPPIALFSASKTTVFAGEKIEFNASLSTYIDKTLLNYTWDFGDGTKGYGMFCNHTYAELGTYTVTLTVSAAEANATYSTIITVTAVNLPPIADFTYCQGRGILDGECINITLWIRGTKWRIVNLTVYAYDDDEDEYAYKQGKLAGWINITRRTGMRDDQWGSVTVCLNTSKNYTVEILHVGQQTGATPVTLNITWREEGYIRLRFPIVSNVNKETNATFELLELLDIALLASNFVKFDASSSYDPDGDVVEWTWIWNYGKTHPETGYGEIAYHRYHKHGTYTVQLTVEDNEDLSHNITKQILIKNYKSLIAAYKKKILAGMACPADLLVTDKSDPTQKIGFENGEFVQTMPNATAIVFGDLEIYLLPMTSEYTYDVTGTGSGTYLFETYHPGDWEPGDWDPSAWDPADYEGKAYSTETTVTDTTTDKLEVTDEGDALTIKSNEDKEYALVIKEGAKTLSVEDIAILAGSTHTLTINDWENLDTSSAAITLAVDEDSDGTIDLTTDLGSGMSGKSVGLQETATINGCEISITYNGIATVDITETTAPANALSGWEFVGVIVDIVPSANITDPFITLRYTELPEGVKESSIKVYYWDDATGRWQPVENSGVWAENNTAWASPEHCTVFAVMAEKIIPPRPLPTLVIYGAVLAVAVIVGTVVLVVIMKRKEKTEMDGVHNK